MKTTPIKSRRNKNQHKKGNRLQQKIRDSKLKELDI